MAEVRKNIPSQKRLFPIEMLIELRFPETVGSSVLPTPVESSPLRDFPNETYLVENGTFALTACRSKLRQVHIICLP